MLSLEKLVLASGNQGKIKELTTLLQPLNIEVVPQSEFNVPDADETGLTFIENAILKARHAAKLTGLPALADDSGIAVDALNGMPGIYSARYAGTHGDRIANMNKLLEAMRDVPDDKRQAAFHCVLAFVRTAEDPTPIICHGIWRGSVLREMRGENGYGYDPVFFIPEHNKSAAELSAAEKNSLSHRGQALKMLLSSLRGREGDAAIQRI